MLVKDRSRALVSQNYFTIDSCDLEEFAALCQQQVALSDYPLAADLQKGILIYDCRALAAQIGNAEFDQALRAEWAEAMANGPGVVVLSGAEPDHPMLDRASKLFRDMIDDQNRTGSGGGDHFAKPGANDRLWNSLEKHCLADPVGFSRYYANPFLALISQAWVGPNYQVTGQLNVVNPGGAAQSPHRDYHLGFQSPADVARYPRHVHLMSPLLTLQGAIAHVDAPIETGPTLLLPHSQKYPPGYLATARPDFRDYFLAHAVQLPLAKGDMLFFSPALFHAAGNNRSADVKRMVNLFQVSSAYGRAIETVDRTRMCKTVFSTLLAARADGSLTAAQLANVVAATAEGYPFPTNLDSDPPIGGLAPKSQAAVMHQALQENWSPDQLSSVLDAQAARRLA